MTDSEPQTGHGFSIARPTNACRGVSLPVASAASSMTDSLPERADDARSVIHRASVPRK